MKSPLQLFVAIAVLLATATVAAQVYRWVDKDGKVHFSDTPPPADTKGATAKKLDVRPASGAASAPIKSAPTSKEAGKDGKDAVKDGPKTLADRNKDFEKRRADGAEAAKKADEEEAVKKANVERCTDAKRYLAGLEAGRPLARTNDQGEREVLDDTARQTEMARARKAMAEVCK